MTRFAFRTGPNAIDDVACARLIAWRRHRFNVGNSAVETFSLPRLIAGSAAFAVRRLSWRCVSDSLSTTNRGGCMRLFSTITFAALATLTSPARADDRPTAAITRNIQQSITIVQLVEAFTKAQHDFDQAQLRALTADDYVEISPIGEVDPRDKMLGFYDPAKRSRAVDDHGRQSVRMIGRDAAIAVTGFLFRADERGPRMVSIRAVFVARREHGRGSSSRRNIRRSVQRLGGAAAFGRAFARRRSGARRRIRRTRNSPARDDRAARIAHRSGGSCRLGAARTTAAPAPRGFPADQLAAFLVDVVTCRGNASAAASASAQAVERRAVGHRLLRHHDASTISAATAGLVAEQRGIASASTRVALASIVSV